MSAQAKHLAKVWSHPDVKPWVALGSPELLTEENAQKILDAGAMYLHNDYGGFLLVPNDDATVFEVHTQFVPEGRGALVYGFADECIRLMFEKTPCEMLRTFIPDGNHAAYSFARRCGFVVFDSCVQMGRSGRILVLTVKKWVLDHAGSGDRPSSH
jgi:hypothetical protein